ncbi:Sodium- and chloride-dependent GABA transporter ine [Nymphon striatum]|nr:Sodium- and chloride-dependent GABA transporter ine [Nymphon striatum]
MYTRGLFVCSLDDRSVANQDVDLESLMTCNIEEPDAHSRYIDEMSDRLDIAPSPRPGPRTFSVTSAEPESQTQSYTPGNDDFQLTVTSVTSCRSLTAYLARQTALRLALTLKDGTPTNTVHSAAGSFGIYGESSTYPCDNSESTGSLYTVMGERGREEWSTKAEFILSCLGYSIGLGNIWRFPFICYKGGGGAFLIPYFIMMFICGVPILFMELAVGQYFKLGPIGALGHICPLLKGAAFASVFVSLILTTYYNVIISWTMFYLINSFRYSLPWSHCNNLWNSKSCFSYRDDQNSSDYFSNISSFDEIDNSSCNASTTPPRDLRTPSEEFFFFTFRAVFIILQSKYSGIEPQSSKRVLDVTSSIDHIGSFRPELLALFVLSWVLVYFCLWKSIRSSGKVVYFTVCFPFILLIAFLIHGLTLPGAHIGLKFFFQPRWKLLSHPKIWILAASQAYNSLGIAYGCMTVMASYNKFNTSILPDTLIISFVNTVFSLLAGIAVFSTLGNIAFKEGKSIENIVDQGPGLVFVAIPEAMSNMPVPQVWAVFFFMLLFLLGLDSQFALVEVVITSLTDSYQDWIKKYIRSHEAFVFIICFIAFLFGLPHLTQGGVYLLYLVDHYAASVSINYIAFFEVIAVSWFYGINNLVKNIYEMTGKRTSIYFIICWRIASPLVIIAIAIFTFYDYKPLVYNSDVPYPAWADSLGWAIALSPILLIPIVACVILWKAEGETFRKKLKNSLEYVPFHPEKMTQINGFQEYCDENQCTAPVEAANDTHFERVTSM